MKTLHLLRHAKSSWRELGLSDRERGLNKRGRRDAPRMGAALASRLAPMPVAVSPARRAQLTLAGLCEGWPGLVGLSHRTEEALYTFSASEVLEWLRAQGDERQEIFVIGHNPALTELINELAGEWVLDNLPTAAYARLELTVDHWAELAAGCAPRVQTLLPRDLPEV